MDALVEGIAALGNSLNTEWSELGQHLGDFLVQVIPRAANEHGQLVDIAAQEDSDANRTCGRIQSEVVDASQEGQASEQHVLEWFSSVLSEARNQGNGGYQDATNEKNQMVIGGADTESAVDAIVDQTIELLQEGGQHMEVVADQSSRDLEVQDRSPATFQVPQDATYFTSVKSNWDYLHVQPNKDDRDTGTVYWAFEPGKGIKIGVARAVPGTDATYGWNIHVDKRFGGGVLSDWAARTAVQKFMELSDGQQSLSEFDKTTQQTFICDMLDAAKKGRLGEEPAAVRAIWARVWLEQHPNAEYRVRPMLEGPQMGAPGTRTQITSNKIEDLFRNDWIAVDQDTGSKWVAYLPKIWLGERTGPHEKYEGVDRMGADDKKVAAMKWATNLAKNFNKVVMVTNDSGPALPYWTTRKAKPEFDKLGNFEVTWGADVVIEGWIGYPIPRGGHKLR